MSLAKNVYLLVSRSVAHNQFVVIVSTGCVVSDTPRSWSLGEHYGTEHRLCTEDGSV